MSSSLLLMPLIYLNMGGEMLYVLHQRLNAQSVIHTKAEKVLDDVILSMYSEILLADIFTPQEMYTQASMLQLFEKVAHSSIMRLNKSSMEKLFELMVMGFKYQILSCQCPQQYLYVTLLHVSNMKAFMSVNSTTHNNLDNAIARLIATYSTLSQGDWLLIKTTMMKFFQGKMVRISLFLLNKLQTNAGVLVLPNIDTLVYGTEVPGHIRYIQSHTNTVHSVTTFPCNTAAGCIIADQFSPLNMPGNNLYKQSLGNVIITAADKVATSAYADAHAKASATMSNIMCKSNGQYNTSPSKYTSTIGVAASAKKELSMLVSLLGGADNKTESKSIRMNLFPSDEVSFKSSSSSSSSNGNSASMMSKDILDDDLGSMIMIEFDAAAEAKTMDSYMEEFGMKEDSKAQSKGSATTDDDDDDDDLLALMDGAK